MKSARIEITLRRLLGLIAVLCGSTALASNDEAQPGETLRKALLAFDQAVTAATNNPDQAQALYRESAAGFEEVLRGGARNAAIETNLGNCYFRLGKVGQAITHYRRALAVEPSAERAAANLAYARMRVEPSIVDHSTQQLLGRLSFWNRLWSLRTQLGFASVVGLFGWGTLTVRLWRRSRGLLVTGVFAALLSAAWLASIAITDRDAIARPHAVTVADQATLRQGRGEGYEPVLKEPLGAGVELRVVDRRGDWVEVLLGNGVTGWLPAGAVLEI